MKENLKFCMITTFYPPYSFGGDAIYVYRLSNELARRGHHVDVIHCEDSYRLLERHKMKSGYPNHENVRIHRMKSGYGFLSPLLTQQTGKPFFKRDRIRRLLDSANYDVIHYHNMSLIGISTLQYGSAVKLYTTHEHWLICPMHVLWKYNREVCTTKSCFSCQIIGYRPPQLWRHSNQMTSMLQHVDTFISPSRFTLSKHLQDGLDIPMIHIPYFLAKVNGDVVSNQAIDLPKGPYFLFVGRLERIKGVQNLIPVFRKLQQHQLVIAGQGTYEAELRKMAAGASNIRFLGKLNQEQLREVYAGATAVIVPSICYEVFGIIIIESFAMKTPVIVNNLGALPEVIHDSDGGFIYNNERELIDAIDKLASDRKLRDELGEKGYSAYVKYWTEESHMNQYLSLIDQLVEQKSRIATREVSLERG